ncbi:hypothetical protein B0H15DRAFT_947968 [Mycena belliarum]|uniref:Uncharacterized protein n=1 Tax=Mycena belliarum TaxID=1033014 RepID=A0AAD6XQR1_9AGAR|nr:hypothetical protein B0H15DRAFT_947968 [Mycena belliae]
MAGQTIPRNWVTACRHWPAFGLPRLLDTLARVVDAQGCFTQAGYEGLERRLIRCTSLLSSPELRAPSGTSAITPRDAPSPPPTPFIPFRECDGICLHVVPFILPLHGSTSPRHGTPSPSRASLLSHERLLWAIFSAVFLSSAMQRELGIKPA